MGKIRVKTIGDEEQEIKDKAKKGRKKAEKKARLLATKTANDGGQTHLQATADPLAEQSETARKITNEQVKSPGSTFQGDAVEAQKQKLSEVKSSKKTKKAKFLKKPNRRSSNYAVKVMDIGKNKPYSLSDALKLLKKVKLSKFDETVELHINTTESGINGTVKLPHGTGKELRIAIASDKLIEQIEKGLPASADAQASGRRGKVDFDILISTPAMMPKLGKVARVLGPRGLMPNPKNGTISDNPEETMKKFQGGQISFKTESKIPLIHLSVGKISFGDEKLSENIKAVITAVKKDRIQKITLKSTMSPAIKLQV